MSKLCFPRPEWSFSKQVKQLTDGWPWSKAYRCTVTKEKERELFLPELPKSFCDGSSLNPTFSNFTHKLNMTDDWYKKKKLHRWSSVLMKHQRRVKSPPNSSSRAWLPVVILITAFLYKPKKITSFRITFIFTKIANASF